MLETGWCILRVLVRPRAVGPWPARLSILVLIALTPAIFPPQTIAEEAEPALREEVVVRVNRVEQMLNDVDGNVTIFTRKEIERSAARTLDDFMRRVPGFSLFRRSSSLVAHPTAQGVSLRGISPSGVSRTLVLIDGVPANDPFGGWVSWGRIPLESIERIEILRGGGSSVWGNAALGGVILIETRDITGKDLSVTAVAGDQEDVDLNLFAGRRGRRLGWSIEGSYFETTGYEIVRPDQAGAIDIEAFSEHFSLRPKIEYSISENSKLSFQAGYFSEDRGNGTPLTNNGTERGEFSVTGEFRAPGGGNWRVALFASDQRFNSTFSAQDPARASESPALDQFAVDSTDVGRSVEWTRLTGSRHLLIAGSDLRRIEGRTNENFFWDGTTFLRARRAGGDQRLAGLFFQDLIAVTPALQLTVGARLDYWENVGGFRMETERATGNILRTEVFEDRDDSSVSPRIGLLHRATDHISIRGSVYRSFRAPTINELYRPFRVRNDITEANVNLAPEILTGAELGLTGSGSGLFGRMTAFWNRVEDPIANVTIPSATSPGVIDPCGFVPAGGSCWQRQNLGETRIIGLEADLEADLSSFWKMSGSYLYSHGEVTDAPNQPALEGRRIAQVPEHQVAIGLTYDNPRLFGAQLQARYVDDQYEDDLNLRRLDDFIVVDLSAWKRVTPGLDLFLGVENLFDETIEAGRSGDGLVTVGAPARIHVGLRLSAFNRRPSPSRNRTRLP